MAPPIALFAPVLNESGVARVMVTLAGAFAAQGYGVDLVVGAVADHWQDRLPPGVTLVKLERRSTFHGWLLASSAHPLGAAALTYSMLRAFKPGARLGYLPGLRDYWLRARPEVVVAAGTVANLMALWANRLAGGSARVIVCEHNNLSGKVRGSRAPGAGKLGAVAKLVRRVYGQADAVVAVSTGVADDLATVTGLARERITTIVNPVVTPELLALAQETPDHPWFTADAPPVVLAVGRLVPAKDFATLLRAFAQVRAGRDLRLMILGDGNQRAALEALAEELGIADHVALPGFVKNPYAYMANAALFVLSSRWEGLVSVLIEALACGCPVVSTDCPSGPAEILQGGGLGPLVPVGDHEALGKAMVAVLDQPPEPSSLQAGAGVFSLDASLSRYLEVIDGTL